MKNSKGVLTMESNKNQFIVHQYGDVNWLQAGVDELFALASIALAYTGIGLIEAITVGGLASGRGAQNFKSIGKNLDNTGRTGVKAILTAFDKYGTGAGYQKVMNLWGSRVADSLAKSISQNFTKSALIIWGITISSYGLSYASGKIKWGF